MFFQGQTQVFFIGRLFAKNYTEPVFPWEKEKTEDRPPTREEMESLQAEAMAWEARLNGTGQDGKMTKGT